MAATAVTATSAVTILDAGFGTIKLVRSLNICNIHTANTAAVTVSVTRITTASEFTLSVFTQVTCQESIAVLTGPIVLNNNDTLRIKCNPVDSVHVVASYLNIDT